MCLLLKWSTDDCKVLNYNSSFTLAVSLTMIVESGEAMVERWVGPSLSVALGVGVNASVVADGITGDGVMSTILFSVVGIGRILTICSSFFSK